MSKLIAEVSNIKEVKSHPNGDNLEICLIKGWEVITRKNQFILQQKCVYIPYDCVLPLSLANGPNDNPPGRLDVAKYCAPVKDIGGVLTGYRVRAARLRGYKSFGIIMEIDPAWGDNPDWEVETDVADHFGIIKWEPPIRCLDGDCEKPNARFHQYTDIEKYQNCPTAIEEGEDVVFTEKAHGQNLRHGYILDADETGNAAWIWMAGSHTIRRKDVQGRMSRFWESFTDNAKALLTFLASEEFPWIQPKNGIICFGELVGTQDMMYGLKIGQYDVLYFDIAINGQYLDPDVKANLFKKFGLKQVPILYRGPFTEELLNQYTDGLTTICEPEKAGKFNGREGIVITPVKERHSLSLNGRCVVKSVSCDYIGRKNSIDLGE